MKQQVSYERRPRKTMAAHGVFTATDRGITLSSVQV